MIDITVTLWIQLVNFLIVLIVLNFLLIRPIREVIKKRADMMGALSADAEQFASAAETKVKDYEAALATARNAAVAELGAVRTEAQAEEKNIMGAAGAEAAATLNSAREEVAGQVKAAMDDLKGQVAPLAEKAAAKLLG